MIYGLVPVGGIGSRLGLPFHKELLPLKGYKEYYPVCRYTVDNMLSAGAEKIVFIHGKNYKKEIIEIFSGKKYIHLNNISDRQSEVFSVFFDNIFLEEQDILFYGLPDTFYIKNLFLNMKEKKGLVCGMYKIDDNPKVGRLDIDTKKFIKSIKKHNNSDFCWGVLKLDYEVLKKFYNYLKLDSLAEAEELINLVDFSLEYGEEYFDLGTWDSLNKYWVYNI